MTIKEILDSAWVRRLGRLSMIATPFLISIGGSIIGWIIYQNYTASADAAALSSQAVKIATSVSASQDNRAAIADERAEAETAWRVKFDQSLSNVNRRVSDVTTEIGELKGDIGELKGLIIRSQAAEVPLHHSPFSTMLGEIKVPR